VVTTGGTGPAPRDVTPEATEAVCSRMLPGYGEQMRAVSLKYVPTAVLSRQTAGGRPPWTKARCCVGMHPHEGGELWPACRAVGRWQGSRTGGGAVCVAFRAHLATPPALTIAWPGIRGESLIINLPGKPKSIRETFDEVFKSIPYCIQLMGGPYIETREAVVAAFRPPADRRTAKPAAAAAAPAQ
jgi:hypothetical protein